MLLKQTAIAYFPQLQRNGVGQDQEQRSNTMR